MKGNWFLVLALVLALLLASVFVVHARTSTPVNNNAVRITAPQQAPLWTPVPVTSDPNVRMPGTQPAITAIEKPSCSCHTGYDQEIESMFNWQGSMMAQAARDFLFWACMTVAAQDSIWAVGNPNATDICERCHFPKGWLEGRSDPTNASAMTDKDYDFDGVQCGVCHRMFDPFFETTYAGTREGNDWSGYWDESGTPSSTAATTTYDRDKTLTTTITMFNGSPFYAGNIPTSTAYTENAAGQFFIDDTGERRASFADADPAHRKYYSRYHKSKYFCSTCHDVSNPVLANLTADPAQPLRTELNPAYSYYHVERTFSEFMLSDYGQQGGAPGIGPFASGVFTTSHPDDYIATCQDCHMRDVTGAAANSGITRPTNSTEHPNSGLPLHDMTGGNLWVPYVLASATSGSPNYDATNDALLNQGASALTLDPTYGLGIDPEALLASITRTRQMLQSAASIENLAYNSGSGVLSFRIQNQTGHKLISGFPEGRRMFVNVKVYVGESLVYEVNPYDHAAGTLKGLSYSYTTTFTTPQSLTANEVYSDSLVYEMHPSSSLTGEDETFHFALADSRYKDNRIPPQGFNVTSATARLSQPVWHGVDAPNYFTAAEYAGGYDDIALTIPPNPGIGYIEVNLYYQTASREYIEFLRNEIEGTNRTLPDTAYVIQSDSFFDQLRAWGDTIWQLWTHNLNVPGAAPFLMAQATLGSPTAVRLSSLQATQEVKTDFRWPIALLGVALGLASGAIYRYIRHKAI